MLESVPSSAELLRFDSESWLTSATTNTPQRASNAVLAPQEPSTLALAFMGIAMIAIYFATSGLRRPRRKKTWATPSKLATSIRRQTAERTTSVPKRDAA